MNELALFAGAGGGILAGKLLGWRTVCAVERDAYAACILAERQNDGILEPFPIWSDVTSFDGHPWRGIIDVVSGGFPCQDISGAGKGAGIKGARSGLWMEMARIVREVQPRYVFVENSPMLTSRGLGVVLGDMAEMGFDARWGVLGAHHTGAYHERERIWILAYRPSERRGTGRQGGSDSSDTRQYQQAFQDASDANGEQHESQSYARSGQGQETRASFVWGEWPSESGLDRVAYGVAHQVDRIRAIGNGQVPRVAATAFTILSQ
ncbi:DNA cytosine methyltransferase [Burkholderia multivorans]|nr:DNA cytosine methyltransferase [Burkholderia multivorans]